jgi:hypothetical protein
MQPRPSKSRPFSALRSFVRPRSADTERCELCGTAIAPEHPHLLELVRRQIVCACDPCALLFPGRGSVRYRRVPRVAEPLADFRMSDAQWDDLLIPIGLAFFFRRADSDRIVALYPGPAGATESLLPLAAWQRLAEDNPVLLEFEPEVETLLVNRIRSARAYYRIGIDQCFKLVGLIRSRWHGISGGAEVWEEIVRFFQELNERAGFAAGGANA